jgi:hypothetical protein
VVKLDDPQVHDLRVMESESSMSSTLTTAGPFTTAPRGDSPIGSRPAQVRNIGLPWKSPGAYGTPRRVGVETAGACLHRMLSSARSTSEHDVLAWRDFEDLESSGTADARAVDLDDGPSVIRPNCESTHAQEAPHFRNGGIRQYVLQSQLD